MRSVLLFFALLITTALQAAHPPLELVDARVEIAGRTESARLPEGYELELLTRGMSVPRLFLFAPNGDLLVGSRAGVIYVVPPPYREPEVLADLGGYPHSVALRDGELLVAKTDGIYRAPYRPGTRRIAADRFQRLAPLPGGGGHNSRTVGVGPDGRVYAALGVTGNCSDQYIGAGYRFDQWRGGVMVLDERADPPRWRPFATGLRNPVGFAWRGDGVLYASNNGPDHLGYEQPPEYFSRLEADSFHGMPWFQYDGKKLVRDRCIERDPPRPIDQVSTPVATFPARNAPMGVAFVPGGAELSALADDAVVALHGSWGTKPSGGAFGSAASRRPPSLVAVRFEGERVVRVEPLVEGFQRTDGSRWARPMGVGVGPDGALYFTSDGGIHGLFRLRKRAE